MKWTENRAEIARIVAQYPEKRSAVMPLLHLAQAERGYITAEDCAAVAAAVDETPAFVESVASFYAMYHRQPLGRFLVTVCRNLPCALGGADRLVADLEAQLGVKAGETSADGLITLEVTSECLGACDGAPCLQVNHQHFHRMTPARVEELLASLRNGELPAWSEPTGMGIQAAAAEREEGRDV